MNFTLFWRIIASVMSGKYSQSASWTREIWALAVFVAGFTLHDWQSQGSERLLALMMMLGSGAFMCFALVERLFFLPRIHHKENDANSPELMEIGRMARNEGVNYDGPRTSPIVSSGGDFAGPDGLDVRFRRRFSRRIIPIWRKRRRSRRRRRPMRTTRHCTRTCIPPCPTRFLTATKNRWARPFSFRCR